MAKKMKPEDYAGIEIDLAEEQLSIYKKWLEENPYDKFADRIEWKQTSNGGSIPMVVSTVESQQKNHRDTLKDFLSLTSAVKELRKKEEEKREKRGGGYAPGIMGE
jgi:hypothetical protein